MPPLVSVDSLKSYLRVQHNADDTLLGELEAQAEARVLAHLGGTPLESTAQTGVRVDVRRDPETGRLVAFLPVGPVDPATVVLTDDAGDPVDAAGFTVLASGAVHFTRDVALLRGPLVMAASVGWKLAPDYGTRVAPLLMAAVRDVVAEHYENRNPTATQEGSGGGVLTQRGESLASAPLPPRVVGMLAPLVRRRFVA